MEAGKSHIQTEGMSADEFYRSCTADKDAEERRSRSIVYVDGVRVYTAHFIFEQQMAIGCRIDRVISMAIAALVISVISIIGCLVILYCLLPKL